MNKKILYLYSILVSILSIIIALFYILNRTGFEIKKEFVTDVLPIVALGVSAAVFFLQIFINQIFRSQKSKETISYNIAIIAFPKSGKTTFITTLFGAVMYGKVDLRGYKAMVKGNATIDAVNEHLSLLDIAIPVGSTTDQTMFSYRLNIEENSPNLFSPQKNMI